MHAKAEDSGAAVTPKASLIAAFRKRSGLLRVQAFSILGLIVLLLGSAIWIFFAAAEITKQDVSVDKSFRRSSDIEAHIRDLEAKLPASPKFEPSDAERKEYQSKVDVLKSKQGEFFVPLEDLNREAVNRIAKKEASVDRGLYDLQKVLKVIPFSYRGGLDDRASFEGFDTQYPTESLILFSSLISQELSLINELNKRYDELAALAREANASREKVRGEYSKKYAQWEAETEKTRSELSEFRSGLKEVRAQESKQKFGLSPAPQEERNVSIPFLIQTNVTRFGPMLSSCSL